MDFAPLNPWEDDNMINVSERIIYDNESFRFKPTFCLPTVGLA